MAAAVLLAARQPSAQSDFASIGPRSTAIPQPEDVKLPSPIAPPVPAASAAVVSAVPAPLLPQLETRKILTPKPAMAAGARSATADPSIERMTPGEPATVDSEPTAMKADAPTTNAAAVESASNVAGHGVTPVTITGCLSNDEETFWLKDTSGADAPKSRNWRSGFLRKRPARVELLDATHGLKLRNYVGQRVSATGLLSNREMRAQSLQRVANTCS